MEGEIPGSDLDAKKPLVQVSHNWKEKILWQRGFAVMLLQSLCNYVEAIKFINLRGTAIECSKLHILDAIGAGIFGSSKGLFQKIWPLFQGEIQFRPEATLLGNGMKISAENAAFLNAICINASNIEDGHRLAACHPAASVVPAASAIAEKKGLNGEELITSIIAGYEIMCKVGMAINPSHLSRGFHTTSTIAPFGAAASASKLLGLDSSTMLSAFGLAASFASGLMVSFPTDARPLQVGRGCQSGVLAVTLAQRGVSASSHALEGKEGFLNAYSDRFDAGKVKAIKGVSKYEIENSYIKIHGGCRHLHAPIDAVMELMRKHEILPEDIEIIESRTYPVAMDFVGVSDPKKGSEGEFSLPFAISVAVLEGKVDPWKFTDQKVNDDSIKSFMDRVKVRVDDQLAEEYPQKRGTLVTIVTRKNKFSLKLDHAKGEPEFPVSRLEVEDKFRDLAQTVFSMQRVNKILEVTKNLEKVKDIRELTELFT